MLSLKLKEIEREICNYFQRTEGIALVYLYGSFAKGKANKWSDIDVGVLYERGKEPTRQTLLEMAGEELSEKLSRDVELVDLREISPIVKHQVFKYAKRLWVKTPRVDQAFLIQSLNEYFDLKKIRRPIEQALQRWSIYG